MKEQINAEKDRCSFPINFKKHRFVKEQRKRFAKGNSASQRNWFTGGKQVTVKEKEEDG